MKHKFNINMIFYYISFLLLLVAMVSIISLFQLGGAIDIILKENLPSALAGEKMSESLIQIHLLIVNKRESDFKEYSGEIDNLAHDFAEALIKAKNNITISGEGDIIKEIEISFRRYRETVYSLKNGESSSNNNRALTDLFNKNADLIKQLMSINNQAIISADEDARYLAKSRSIWMIFLALVGFISIFYLIRTIHHNFSQPIYEMLLKLRRIKLGDQNIRLSKRDGELGELAEHINNLLDFKATTQSKTLNYAFEQRDLLSALVEIYTDPLFIFDIGYRIVVSNEKARSILRNDSKRNLEEKLCKLIQKKEKPKIIFDGVGYNSNFSILRDRGFNKIGYTIVLTKSK